MKLKGISKLILAGTALAATAATLTTSTYAWYVTNSKVEATGVSGATAGESVAGSLLISQNSSNNTPLNYTTKINLASDVQAEALDPQTKAPQDATSKKYYYVTADSEPQSGKTYYTANSGATSFEAANTSGDLAAFVENTVYYEEYSGEGYCWVDKEGNLTTSKLVTFSFWLKASKTIEGISVYTKFKNTATTKYAVDSAKKQTFYAGTGLPTGKVQGDKFVVDAVYALRMEVTQQAYTIAAEETYSATSDQALVTGKTYYTRSGEGTEQSPYEYTAVVSPDVEDIGNYYEKDAASTKTGDALIKETGVVEQHNACYPSATYASPKDNTDDIFDSHTGGDANIYYKTVMQKAGYKTNATTGASPTASNTTWTSINLTGNVDTLITINIWLEGTDAQCWDSCIGQGFGLELLFEKSGNI